MLKFSMSSYCSDFILLCSTVQAVNMEVEKVELKVKPQEGVGKKRVAHEAKHLEVNVEHLDSLNCKCVQVIHCWIFFLVKSCGL